MQFIIPSSQKQHRLPSQARDNAAVLLLALALLDAERKLGRRLRPDELALVRAAIQPKVGDRP